jgi:hypothetical protein
MFKDVGTGKEMEVEFDMNEISYKVAKDEIDRTCNDEGNCKMAGVKYNATLQYKLVDIYDWNGEEALKTGKKEKRWILTKLTKVIESNLHSTQEFVIKGKVILSEEQGNAFHRLLVKSNQFASGAYNREADVMLANSTKIFKNGKLILTYDKGADINSVIKEGQIVGIVGKDSDDQIWAKEIHLLKK